MIADGWERLDLGEQLGGGREGELPAASSHPGSEARCRQDLRRASLVRGAYSVGTAPALPGLRRHLQLGERLDGVADRRGGVGVETGQELAVRRVARHQLLVRAVVGHPAAVQEHHPVREMEGGDPVGDDQRRTSGEHATQSAEDGLLGTRVDRARGVVEKQDAGFHQHGSRQRDPLPLATGEAEPALADLRVVAVGELADEVVGAGDAGRRLHLLAARAGTAVGDVGGDRVGEEEALPERSADLAPQGVQRDAADVVPVDQDLPAVGVEQPLDQADHCRLAAA